MIFKESGLEYQLLIIFVLKKQQLGNNYPFELKLDTLYETTIKAIKEDRKLPIIKT